MKTKKKKIHMLEIELEYQRHARKLYLCNYIFRLREAGVFRNARERNLINTQIAQAGTTSA